MNAWTLVFVLNLIALFASLLLLVINWPLGIHKTFSQHAAQNKRLSLYYFSVFIITMPIMCLFIYFWLIPQYNVSNWVFVSFLLATFAQIVCTLFPEKGLRKQVLIHRLFAGTSAAFLFVCLILFCLSLSDITQIIGIVGLCVMSIVAITAVIAKGRFVLIFQAVYYLAFFIPISVLLLA